MALELTDTNFQEEVLNSNKPALIDFWAEWCGPCRTLGPIVEQISKDYEGKVVVGKLNVDDNSAIAEKYGIRNIPTILFIKGGEVVDKQVGVVPKTKLAEKLDAIL